MQNNKVLATIGCLMVAAATVTDYGAGRIAIPTAHRVPVEAFPLRIGSWVAGPRLAVDQGVQEKLSKATILERVYSDGRRTPVDCMLVTADTSENLHDPTMCFPAPGLAPHEREVGHRGGPAASRHGRGAGGPGHDRDVLDRRLPSAAAGPYAAGSGADTAAAAAARYARG